jgi:aminoglycoside phosphotransferase (APT) family kinase protein
MDAQANRRERDLGALITGFGVPAEVTPLTSMLYGYAPSAFRVRFADGRIAKAKVLPGPKDTARVHALLQQLDHPALPKVLGVSGRVLLTEWISGTPLSAAECDTAVARTGGAILASLHQSPVPANMTRNAETVLQRREADFREALDRLVACGALAAAESATAVRLAAQHAPDTCTVGIVHNDFCPENLVRRSCGDLCLVDNETLEVDACEFDLGRTWYRWPMAARQRRAFFDGYAIDDNRDRFLAAFPFWTIAATVKGAVFRTRGDVADAAVPLERLRRLLHDLQSGVPVARLAFDS